MPEPWELDWSKQPTTAAPATDVMPWEKDWGGGKSSGEGDFLHPVKPAPGSGWTGVLQRIGQYPRIAIGELLDAGHTLGRVASGELDATDPEAIGAAQTAVQVANPTSPAYRTGAQIARRAFSPGKENPGFNPISEPTVTGPRSTTVLGRQPFVPESAPLPEGLTPGQSAAQTAAEIGAPLPAGIVSQTPGTQAFTQGFRQVPFVGPAITHKVGETVKAAGEKVGDIAEELSRGPITDRATVGGQTQQALKDLIDRNNATIDVQYDDLRRNHIQSHLYASPSNTSAVLNDIKAKRISAGKADPEAGLADVENFVRSGRSFDGMVRARSDIGRAIGDNFRNPNPGFPTGDMKRIYGAMSQDLERAARINTRPGVQQSDAVAAFRKANDTAKEMIEANDNVNRLMSNSSPEGILGNIIGKAKEKGGNAQLLGQLRTQLPPEDFNRIAGIAVHELGHTEQGFSLNKFSRAWKEQLSPTAKNTLFADPAHRKALDDIANLGSFLKDADKYRNTSNTAHGAGVAGAIVGLGHMLTQVAEGNWHAVLAELGALAGGYGISRIIGRPVSASALRRWLEVARDKQMGRWGNVNSAKGTAALTIATRNLVNNLPTEAQGESSKREPLRLTVHPIRNKNQDRAPSAAALP